MNPIPSEPEKSFPWTGVMLIAGVLIVIALIAFIFYCLFIVYVGLHPEEPKQIDVQPLQQNLVAGYHLDEPSGEQCPEYHVWNHYYEIPGNKTHLLFNGEIVSRELLAKCFNVTDIKRWDWVHRAEEANCSVYNWNCHGINWTNCTCEPYVYPEDREYKAQTPHGYVSVDEINITFADKNMTALKTFSMRMKAEENSRWHLISWDGNNLKVDDTNIITLQNGSTHIGK